MRPRTSSVGTVRVSGGSGESVAVDQRGPGFVRRPELAAHEAGIPVPDPPTVGTLANVLAEAVEVGGSRAVRVVRGDGVGDLVEGVEAVEVTLHEVTDAADSLAFDPWSDVDEHQRSGDRVAGSLRDRHERRDAPQRRPDQRRRLGHRPSDRPDVAGEPVDRVVPVGGPVAVAVTAQVDRVGVPVLGECLQRGAPGMAGLAPTVQEDDGRGGGVARLIGDEGQAIGAGELNGCHAPCLTVLTRPEEEIRWMTMYQPQLAREVISHDLDHLHHPRNHRLRTDHPGSPLISRRRAPPFRHRASTIE